MERLLILEDDLALGEGVRLALQGDDRPVTLCRTLAQARQALEEAGPFALLILDVNLPDGSGLSLLEEVKGRVPVILLTANDLETDIVAGLELGALAVTVETEASGITALPMGQFLLFMLPIHLFIGIGEGLATAAVIYVVQRYKPELLSGVRRRKPAGKRKFGKALAAIALTALLIGGSFSWVASSDPDGLEWSIAKVAGPAGPEAEPDGLHRTAAAVQEKTAVMPDYNTSFAGIVGCGAILLVVFGASRLFRAGQKQG